MKPLIIQEIDKQQIAEMSAIKQIPDFRPGDNVRVSVLISEGDKKRTQIFEGLVIAKKNSSITSSFIVRKVTGGEGVERRFMIYSPLVTNIEVIRRGDVSRAKLYYIRDRKGKSARIKEKMHHAK